MPYLIQVLQSLVVLLAAPLYAGTIMRADAIVGSKRGPSVLQPYRDLAKLLRKGSVFSDQASWVSRGALLAGHAFEFPFGPVRQVGVESLSYGLVTSGGSRRPVPVHLAQAPRAWDINLYLFYVFVVILVAYLIGAL